MPNRTEAARRKPSHLPTGRLQPLRLFSTPLASLTFMPPSSSWALDSRRGRGKQLNHRGSYRKLLANGKAALLAAIEIYNKPQIAYRDECFVILLLNPWDLIVKAVLAKNRTSTQAVRTIRRVQSSWRSTLIDRPRDLRPKSVSEKNNEKASRWFGPLYAKCCADGSGCCRDGAPLEFTNPHHAL